MALTYARHTVAVTGINAGKPASWGEVEVEGIHVPVGARYGSCRLSFPEAYAFKSLPGKGEIITVTLDGTKLFTGYVTGYPGGISPDGERQMLRAVDPRWRMSNIRVGDTDYSAAFPIVGYRIHFNPDGRANRSASADGGSGLYTFDISDSAGYWTYKQILNWLVKTYLADHLVLDLGGLSADWDKICLNWMPYLMPLNRAISELAAQVGQTWGIAPRSADTKVNYVPVVPGGSSTFTVNLPEVGTGGTDKASGSAANSVVFLEGESSIEYATDTVEVHTGPTLVEHTYTSDGTDPLLVEFTPADKRFLKAYRVDVTKYAAHSLGVAYPANARPKPWMSELITRKSNDDVFIAAGSAAESAGLGKPFRPEECLWITIGSERMRVIGGFEIRLDVGEILFEDTVQIYRALTQPTPLDLLGQTIAAVHLTVVTEIEAIDSYRASATALLAAGEVVELVLRSDIRPQVRYLSDIPIWNGTSYNTYGSPSPEFYRDHDTPLQEYADRLLEARRRPETKVQIRTIDLTTAVALGRKLAISPASTGLDADVVITDVYYDLARGVDALVVTGTNNLSEYF